MDPLAPEQEDLAVVDPSEENVVEAIEKTVGQERFAAIIDTVGTADTFGLALPLMAESATYVNLAVHSTPVAFDPLALASERTITTSSRLRPTDASLIRVRR